MTEPLLTRWGRSLDPERVLQEYPRPQLVRDSYLNLNGWWDHAITPAEEPAPTKYDGRILVPFSPEAALSGVGRQLQPDERLWYRRTLTVPKGFRPGDPHRVMLHFGAVDQTARVLVNGTVVAEHTGGFLPFTADVTDALHEAENDLVVAVRDLSDTGHHAVGKQRLHRGGIWYTAQSGIWQTVWVECVPVPYVERLVLVPRLEAGALEVSVVSTGSTTPEGSEDLAEVVVRAGDAVVGRATVPVGRSSTIPLSVVRPWTPDDPFLYDVEVTCGRDRVTSYAGLRSFGVGPDAAGVPRLLLNGEPFFHAGVLDQGYWSDGMLTAPSDEAMVHDIELMKRLGFTMLRKHLKVEPLRWYHHCDRLGMLVWQDAVNGGHHYRTAVVKGPAIGPLRLSDRWHALFGRSSTAGRAEFEVELRAMVEHLGNVVALAVWVPFNEGWGQFDAARIAADVKTLDPTRSVDHASGWHDQRAGDLWSLHVYLHRIRVPTRRRGDRRALVLSEYGGYNLRVPGHVRSERDFGYRRFRSADALGTAFRRLHEEELRLAVTRGLSASVYTQLSDVEDELNGLVTYDREVLKLPAALVREVLERLAGEPAIRADGR